jgi:RimJ/RimL family protein N-acetyltransferase
VAEDPAAVVRTERLELHPPAPGDLAALFAINREPRVWTHYPSLRQTDPQSTRAQIARWLQEWAAMGLSFWVIREPGASAVVGYGGCAPRPAFWNLGYRLSPAVHGRGYASELAAEALRRARTLDPGRPVIARLVEHNAASRRVAIKLGLTLAYRALDTDNPDPSAVRLIFADRTLSAGQLASVVG